MFLWPVLPQKDNILIIKLASIKSNTKYFYRHLYNCLGIEKTILLYNVLHTEKSARPTSAAGTISTQLLWCLVLQACFVLIFTAHWKLVNEGKQYRISWRFQSHWFINWFLYNDCVNTLMPSDDTVTNYHPIMIKKAIFNMKAIIFHY